MGKGNKPTGFWLFMRDVSLASGLLPSQLTEVVDREWRDLTTNVRQRYKNRAKKIWIDGGRGWKRVLAQEPHPLLVEVDIDFIGTRAKQRALAPLLAAVTMAGIAEKHSWFRPRPPLAEFDHRAAYAWASHVETERLYGKDYTLEDLMAVCSWSTY